MSSQFFYHHAGQYYFNRTGRNASTVVSVVNTLVAVPFILPRACRIDAIAFEVTTGGAAGSVARVGIYANKANNNLEPGTLILDGGQHDTTGVGMKITTFGSLPMAVGLYWLAMLAGVSAPSVRATPDIPQILGMGSSGLSAISNGWEIGQAYGALPTPFPLPVPPSLARAELPDAPIIALRVIA